MMVGTDVLLHMFDRLIVHLSQHFIKKNQNGSRNKVSIKKSGPTFSYFVVGLQLNRQSTFEIVAQQ